MVERFNRTLKEMLSMYVNDKTNDWDDLLPFVQYAYNTSTHDVTKRTPFSLLFGFEATFPVDIFAPTADTVAANIHDEYKRVQLLTQEARESTRDRYNDRHTDRRFEVGDRVYVYDPRTKTGTSSKLSHHYYGPFEISQVCGPVTYKIKKNMGRGRLEDVVHVSRLKQFFDRREMFGPLHEELPHDLSKLNIPLVPASSNQNANARPVKHAKKPKHTTHSVVPPVSQPPQVATRSGRVVRPTARYGYANCAASVPTANGNLQSRIWMRLLMLILTLIVWGASTYNAQTANITQLCDCSAPITHGIVNLGPTHFRHEDVALGDVRISKTQNYAITVVRNVMNTIPAYACRQWRDVIQIVGFFPYGHDTDRWKESLVVSFIDCWALVQNKLCGSKPMQQEQNTMSYIKRAELEPAWARTTSTSELNCVVEVVQLQRVCELCPVMSLHGQIAIDANKQQGHLGDITYVWSVPKNSSTICDEHTLLTSTGRLFKHANQTVLRDTKRQLDIILTPGFGHFAACKKGLSYGYVGQKNIRVYLLANNKTDLPFPPANNIEELIRLHNQWMEDRFVDSGDELTRALNVMQCTVVTNRLALLQMLSVFSPLLAGELMGFKTCQGATVIGSTAEIIQCKNVTAIIDATASKCGVQPLVNRYLHDGQIRHLPLGNRTIARDGYALVPYSPCLWHGGRIKAGANSLRYQLNEWRAEIGLYHPVAGFVQQMASITKYAIDVSPSTSYAHTTNAAPDYVLTMLQEMASAFASEDIAPRDVIKRADEVRHIYWPFFNLRRLTTTMWFVIAVGGCIVGALGTLKLYRLFYPANQHPYVLTINPSGADPGQIALQPVRR